MTDRPLVLATLDGYAVEGGFDGRHQPATCYLPTIALGRHSGPGEAEDLWRDYERVIDLAATLGLDGLRLDVEWARVEPRRGEVDVAALDRYVAIARHATALGLKVTAVIVDAVWPSWLGLEAWLLPWVVPCVITQAQRVVAHLGDVEHRVLVFTSPNELVTNGYINEMAPPWRRGASDDAASARTQIDGILRSLRADPAVGPKMVGATHTLGLELSPDRIARERSNAENCEEIYVRSLVKGFGPTSGPGGLLARRGDEWVVSATPELLSALS